MIRTYKGAGVKGTSEAVELAGPRAPRGFICECPAFSVSFHNWKL